MMFKMHAIQSLVFSICYQLYRAQGPNYVYEEVMHEFKQKTSLKRNTKVATLQEFDKIFQVSFDINPQQIDTTEEFNNILTVTGIWMQIYFMQGSSAGMTKIRISAIGDDYRTTDEFPINKWVRFKNTILWYLFLFDW